MKAVWGHATCCCALPQGRGPLVAGACWAGQVLLLAGPFASPSGLWLPPFKWNLSNSPTEGLERIKGVTHAWTALGSSKSQASIVFLPWPSRWWQNYGFYLASPSVMLDVHRDQNKSAVNLFPSPTHIPQVTHLYPAHLGTAFKEHELSNCFSNKNNSFSLYSVWTMF